MIPACVSVTSNILEIKTGPNSLIVALSLTPSCSDSVITSTGNAFASNGKPIFS